MHKVKGAATVSILTIGLLGYIASPALADDEASNAVDAVEAATPATFSNVATSAVNDDTVRLGSEQTTATLSSDPSDGIGIQTPHGLISVDVPFAAEASNDSTPQIGVSNYDNRNGSSTVVVAQSDGAVSFNTVISDSSAPESYTYALKLPAGDTLSLDPETNGVSVLNPDGKWVAGVAAPWASDADGASVPTHFTVAGSRLTQTIEHRAENISYPVVADPWLGTALIDHVTWISTGTWGPTAQIFPTSFARNSAPPAANEAAWGEALEKTTRSKLDHNNLHDQFTCHWQIVRVVAGSKSSWNLDSKRPDVGLAATISAGCNPT